MLTLSKVVLDKFENYLNFEEYAVGSIDKYIRDVKKFAEWIGDNDITKGAVLSWKKQLLSVGYSPVTINSMLVSVNCLLKFLGKSECKVKSLRVQRRIFRNAERELTKEEYVRLVETARNNGKERLALLMETICATGIRVSEVKAITVEAIERGRAEIYLKGKIRIILLPNKLCRRLKKYAQKKKIASGEIFLTRSGKSISRRQIWSEMKKVCKLALVAATKVFPHNLRHLFARAFYQAYHDIVKLADVLGHSSIETTRIYLVSTSVEHSHKLENLELICKDV